MKANFFKIGVFVISAVILAVLGVIVLGAGVLFRHEVVVETYFEESVQGLGEGSNLTFRGVPVGQVSKITLTNDVYNTQHRYALVRASLQTDVFQLKGNKNASLANEIAKGLRVRLALQGLTGAVYLEADYVPPEEHEPIRIDWDPKYPYIPAVPSTVTRVTDALESIMRSFERINIQGIGKELQSSMNLLSSVSSLIQSLDVRGLGQQSEKLVAELRETNAKISKLFSGDINQSMKQLESAFQGLNALISGHQGDIQVTLNNFRAASENLREITENAKRYPSQLFFGEPPPRSR